MKWFLFRQGVYWPSMLKDCIDFAKRCQEFQIHAGIQQVPTSELHSVGTKGVFAKSPLEF